MKPLLVEVRLPDDQLATLAGLIAERVGSNRRPLSVPQAAEALGLSTDTIRRRVDAGLIATLPRPMPQSRVLIPAAEIDRLLNPQPEENAR